MNPLESIFEIVPGSTPATMASAEVTNQIIDPSTGEVIERKTENISIDEIEKEERIEDLKIDNQIDSIHTAAMNAFNAQSRLIETVDPKFAARNAEVAAQYLKIALDSVGTRVDAKFKRAKIRSDKNQGPRSVQNNLIVADRNELLKNLFDGDKE